MMLRNGVVESTIQNKLKDFLDGFHLIVQCWQYCLIFFDVTLMKLPSSLFISILQLTLTYYLPSSLTSVFRLQRGLGSATCLDCLIAFLHLRRSSTKEVDDRSLSRSLLMLSNHLFFCKIYFLSGPFFIIHTLEMSKPTETIVSDKILYT